MKTKDRFNFFMPATISKGKDKDGNEEMFVQGVASTPDEDLEGESLNPSGYDTSYFLKSGWLKWEHGKDPSAFIGEPTEAKITKANELFIKGRLYNDSKTAKEVYDLIDVLGKSKSNRQVGWSIEGKATQRNKVNPKIVEKAIITNIVLTTNPIGKNTFAEIVKGQYKEAFIEPEYEITKACDGKECVLDIIDNGMRIIVDTKFNIIKKSIKAGSVAGIKKSMEAGHTTGTETTNKLDSSGAPVKNESVEGDSKKLESSDFDNCDDDPDNLKKNKECVAKALIVLFMANKKGLFSNESMKKVHEKVIVQL